MTRAPVPPTEIRPVYLLTGADSLSKKDYEKKIADLVNKEFGSSERISLYAFELSFEDIQNEILSGSLFNSHKIVSLRQAERLFSRKNKLMKEFVLGYSSKKEYPATLILTTEKDTLEGVSGLPDVNFKPPYDDKMPDWISGRVRQMGRSITQEAAALIAFGCGRNLRAVMSELEKIMITYPDLKKIGLEEVKSVSAVYRKDDIFGYLDALMDNDVKKALKILKNLIDFGNEPVRIIAMIKWKMQKMINSRILINKGVGEWNIIKKLKLKPAFRYKGLCAKMEKFPLPKLVKSYENLKEIDIKLKTTSTDAGLLLEKFTVSLLNG